MSVSDLRRSSMTDAIFICGEGGGEGSETIKRIGNELKLSWMSPTVEILIFICWE